MSKVVPHLRNLLINISRLVSSKQLSSEGETVNLNEHFLLDIDIICRDGSFRWNCFLLAANSKLLAEALLLSAREEYVLMLPDVTTSTVRSMLECTVNVAVKRDTLSVNEQEVMRLLGFDTLVGNYRNDSFQPAQETSKKPQENIAEELPISLQSSNNSLKEIDTKAKSQGQSETKQQTDIPYKKTKEGRFVCLAKDCGMMFQRKLHFERHTASHSKTNLFVCDQCGKIFYHIDNLKQNQKYHEDVTKIFDCPQCDHKCNGQRALKCHIDTHHTSRIPCQFCGKLLKKRLLPRHLRAIHHSHAKAKSASTKEPLTFSADIECRKCDQTFASPGCSSRISPCQGG